MGLFAYLLLTFSPIILNVLKPLNESRLMQPVYPALFPFDQDKYLTYILFYGVVTSILGILIFCAIDGMYITTVHHACGLFAIIRSDL